MTLKYSTTMNRQLFVEYNIQQSPNEYNIAL